MSFQFFCNKINDGQKITAEKTFLLTYTNTKDEAFSISPEIVRVFLNFFIDNYDDIYKVWESAPTKKESIVSYEEKSYRKIYKFADSGDLKLISSAGSSQTKALTQLISKIISFLAGVKYLPPEENTFFSKVYISKALSVWEKFFDKNKIGENSFNRDLFVKSFESWMISKGLSARTAKSYSGTGILFSDKFISDIDFNKESFYLCKPKKLLTALDLLRQIPEWLSADTAGNSMYSAALKKLAEYFNEQAHLNMLSKPFLLLAGISGTGKTRFVREQAKATGSLAETYCLTPVRPDWHEPSDLLGYTSRLNGKAEYITTDVLQFIAKAWRAKIDAGLSLDVEDSEGHGTCFFVSGEEAQLDSVLPYWLCLDEMNLAPVEQYFSDYLSILETREWLWTGDSFQYLSDPLLKASTIQQLEVAEQVKLREELGFADDHYDELWILICEYGMGIPFNLIVAGTVNMDETTHGFSRKVIDRALSFDFGEFFPNDYAEFFEPTIGNKTLSYPVLSHANRCKDKLLNIDTDGQKSINFLNAVNAVLDNTPFKLAYRALNELLLAVISEAPEDQDTLHLQAVWDDFLMSKVLPRIEGDSDKLLTDDNQQSLLQALSLCLEKQLSEIWEAAKDADTDNARPDLYREKVGAEGDAKVLRIACRSKAKLEWMQKRLERSGFTSFWP